MTKCHELKKEAERSERSTLQSISGSDHKRLQYLAEFARHEETLVPMIGDLLPIFVPYYANWLSIIKSADRFTTGPKNSGHPL